MIKFTIGIKCDECGKTIAKEFNSIQELEDGALDADMKTWIEYNSKHFCSDICKTKSKMKALKGSQPVVESVN